MLALVSTGNRDGAQSALIKVFQFGERQAAPDKSAFSRFRKKISWTWFRDCLVSLIEQYKNIQSDWEGMRVYAIDGQQLTLPREPDIVNEGFTGRATSKYRGSYMPKGYLTHLYDVVSGLTRRITFNPTLHEQADAMHLLDHVESGSLMLYDRLYFSQRLVEKHHELGLKFIFRCRKNANRSIERFFNSTKRCCAIKVANKTIHLIRVKHPGTKKVSVFATNLPARLRAAKIIASLYRCRWEVELSFREVTDQTRTEQWHSKSYNGILQELYTQFWLINYTKANMRLAGQKPCHPRRKTYKKANFKVCYQFVCHYLVTGFDKLSYLTAHLEPLIKQTTEKRKHFSRSYERQIKSPASPYSHYGSTWHWELV